ncbi:MAG: hypothetical protein AMXMBFR34_41120 [Myxococcaceae bacterium]
MGVAVPDSSMVGTSAPGREASCLASSGPQVAQVTAWARTSASALGASVPLRSATQVSDDTHAIDGTLATVESEESVSTEARRAAKCNGA